MDRLLKIDEIALAESLKQWFKDKNFDKPHFLERNIVAKVLREELGRIGRWSTKRAPNRATHLRKFKF
jgi:hypothetical protein